MKTEPTTDAGLRERLRAALWEAARESSGEVYARPDALADALLPVVEQHVAGETTRLRTELDYWRQARDHWHQEAFREVDAREKAEVAMTVLGPELDRLAAEVDRVRALHVRADAGDGAYCQLCADGGDIHWPCATIAALDDTGEAS
jgi:hypothetical protein